MNPLDVAGALTGLVNVGLLVRNSPWNFPWAIINVTIYLFAFWTAGLYGDASLQAVYICLNAYGWWAWVHGGADRTPLPISRLDVRGRIAAAAGVAVLAAVFAPLLARFLHSSVPWADGTTTALSLVAQLLLNRRIYENWWLWIAADCIYVPLYAYKHLPFTAALYTVFIALCVAGLRSWRAEIARA